MNDLYQLLEQITPLALAEGRDATAFLPVQASTAAPSSDFLFDFIHIVSLFFFVIIAFLMFYFPWKFRRREEGEQARPSAHHNLPLELAWSILPGFVLIYIFFKGFTGYMDQLNPPDDGYPITVRAKQWSWEFIYPNGYSDSNLTVPAHTPVVLLMESSDVLHSFFIPEFRVKMDIVPGKYSKVWFEATRTAEGDDHFNLWCAEYCGTDHSRMLAKVFVLEQGKFEDWLEDVSDISHLSPVERAERWRNIKGCTTCHSIDGTVAQGPTWKGIWGAQEQLTDGSSVTVDENYIKESILYPQKQVVKGYETVVMPTYKGQITDEQILDLIELIKSVK